jgi:hypothetical protein
MGAARAAGRGGRHTGRRRGWSLGVLTAPRPRAPRWRDGRGDHNLGRTPDLVRGRDPAGVRPMSLQIEVLCGRQRACPVHLERSK